MLSNLSQEIGHLRMSRAWAGGSILKRPASASLQAKGFYFTASQAPPYVPLKPLADTRQYAPPDQSQKQSQDNVVVLEAMQRLLRQQKDVPKPFEQFGQSRPIR